MKVLIARTDRLGDLVLSLPVFQHIKSQRPDWSLHALVAPGSVPLVENEPAIDKVWTWVPGDTCVRRELLKAFRKERFTASVMLQYHRELATLLKNSHIPRRYGPLSKLGSWFLLNRGLMQNRSRCRHHEMHYNLQLASKLLGSRNGADGGDADSWPEPVLKVSEGQRELGREFRSQFAGGAQVVAFVHPGSGGSALDWEPERFAGVANSLASLENWRVFVTGAGGDMDMVGAVRGRLAAEVKVLLDEYELRDFLGVLSEGDLFIGPSTGPLHMAAALGLATVGLYPPVPTMAPGRWGPRGDLARTVVPPVDCPSSRFCYREQCEHYNCLSRLFERDVLDMALSLVKQKQDREGKPMKTEDVE